MGYNQQSLHATQVSVSRNIWGTITVLTSLSCKVCWWHYELLSSHQAITQHYQVQVNLDAPQIGQMLMKECSCWSTTNKILPSSTTAKALTVPLCKGPTMNVNLLTDNLDVVEMFNRFNHLREPLINIWHSINTPTVSWSQEKVAHSPCSQTVWCKSRKPSTDMQTPKWSRPSLTLPSMVFVPYWISTQRVREIPEVCAQDFVSRDNNRGCLANTQ